MRFAVPVVLALLLGGSPAPAQELKIGVFEFGRVSQETNEGLRLQKELMEFQERKRAELEQREKELRELQDQLVAQALSLSPEKRAAMEKDLQKKQNELQVARDGAQREWQIEFNEAQTGFQQKVIEVVEQIGREGNYTLILERDQAVYRSEAVDVTDTVIARLNQISPPAPPAASGAGGTAPKPPAPPR